MHGKLKFLHRANFFSTNMISEISDNYEVSACSCSDFCGSSDDVHCFAFGPSKSDLFDLELRVQVKGGDFQVLSLKLVFASS